MEQERRREAEEAVAADVEQERLHEAEVEAQRRVPDFGHFDVIYGRVPEDGRKRKLLLTSVRVHDTYSPWYETMERLVSREERLEMLERLCVAHEQGEYWVEYIYFKDSH